MSGERKMYPQPSDPTSSLKCLKKSTGATEIRLKEEKQTAGIWIHQAG